MRRLGEEGKLRRKELFVWGQITPAIKASIVYRPTMINFLKNHGEAVGKAETNDASTIAFALKAFAKLTLVSFALFTT